MYFCHIAQTIFRVGRSGISNVVIDDRKICFVKRSDNDAPIISELSVFIVNIDDMRIVANIVIVISGAFDDTTSCLITAVGIDES